MSDSIWHKPSETTDVDNNLIINDWTNRTYELGYFDDNDMIFRNLRNDDTYSEESMMCWCDIDDLIAQADKAERLQKAVGLTVALAEETIDDIEYEGMCSDEYQKRLSEIKQLIKGE